MLACTAMLVGCTDDVIENDNGSNKQSELVRGDAYVNIVINTSTNSSRGTTGDDHSSAEDNKHHVAGVGTENKVNELLLVIAKVDEESPTNELYGSVKTEANDQVANGYVGKPAFTTTDNIIKMNAPIRLDYTGKYKVLAVINPADDLLAKITLGGNHKEAYEKILEHVGTAAYKEIINEKGEKELSFQMSNQSECLIEAKVEHSVPTNPVVASIAVERTTSKTTWRPTSSIPDDAQVPEALKDRENLYAVKVNVGKAKAETANYWFKDVLTSGPDENKDSYDAFYYGYNLNKAKHTDGKFYWVLLAPGFALDNGGKIDADDVIAIFEDAFYTKAELSVLDASDEYTGVIDDQTLEWTDDAKDTDNQLASKVGSEETAKVLKDSYTDAKGRKNNEFIQGLTFVYGQMSDNDADDTHYFVNLTHYALTNLADKVYAVRHTDGGIMKALTNDWLLTPALTYGNTLAEVNKAAAALTSTNIDSDKTFKPLPTSESRNDGIAYDELKEGETATTHDGKAVGYFMEYLKENAPKTDQSAGNITGIVLAGNIYDNTGNIVPVLYKYNQMYYRSLRALVNAQTTALKYKDSDGKEYILTENSTDDQAKAAGIDVYNEGRCFYYSSQIKHFEDNVKEGFGIMEYAIMRNNVYSLAVKGVTEIGDAQLELTQSTPIEDIRAYVTLEVSILPWIVRFNDLEL